MTRNIEIKKNQKTTCFGLSNYIERDKRSLNYTRARDKMVFTTKENEINVAIKETLIEIRDLNKKLYSQTSC